MRDRRGLWLGIGLVLAGVIGGGTWVAAKPDALASGTASGSAQGMMGAASGSRWTTAHVTTLVHNSERDVTIDRTTNTITYHADHVVLVPLAAPQALPGMRWEIDGLVDPRVVVPAGAHVTVDLVNEDPGYLHGFLVTTAHPPFGDMAMMQGTMPFANALIMPIAPPTGAGFAHATTTFIAAAAGTYAYICPVPGHAAHGMAGRLVVT